MNSRKVSLERRRFLQLVGASALTYPFLRGVPSYAAASGSAPTYMVLVFTPCGMRAPVLGRDRREQEARAAAGRRQPGDVDQQLRLPRHAEALRLGGTVAAPAGRRTCRTRSSSSTGSTTRPPRARTRRAWRRCGPATSPAAAPATSPSIDQQIAAKLNAGTPFPSIQLMVRNSADFTDREVKTRMIYNAAGVLRGSASTTRPGRNTFFPPQAELGICRARQEHLHPPEAVRVVQRHAEQRAQQPDAAPVHQRPAAAAGAAARVERSLRADQAAADGGRELHGAGRRAGQARIFRPAPSCRWTSSRWRWPVTSRASAACSSRRRPAR